jgi:hypothetical protein
VLVGGAHDQQWQGCRLHQVAQLALAFGQRALQLFALGDEAPRHGDAGDQQHAGEDEDAVGEDRLPRALHVVERARELVLEAGECAARLVHALLDRVGGFARAQLRRHHLQVVQLLVALLPQSREVARGLEAGQLVREEGEVVDFPVGNPRGAQLGSHGIAVRGGLGELVAGGTHAFQHAHRTLEGEVVLRILRLGVAGEVEGGVAMRLRPVVHGGHENAPGGQQLCAVQGEGEEGDDDRDEDPDDHARARPGKARCREDSQGHKLKQTGCQCPRSIRADERFPWRMGGALRRTGPPKTHRIRPVK